MSVLGTGPRFSKTELVQRDTVSPSQMSLYKDYQVFSHTHCKTFSVCCTDYRILPDNIELYFTLFLFAVLFRVNMPIRTWVLEPFAIREPLGHKMIYSLFIFILLFPILVANVVAITSY